MAYIDVDKFAEKICDFQAIDEDCATKMIWLLRTFPTADVVKVKHGEWIDLNITEWQCSECNYRVERWNNTPYCPNCGAKMDGGKTE